MNRSTVFATSLFLVALGAALWLAWPDEERVLFVSVPGILAPVELDVRGAPEASPQPEPEMTQSQAESSAWIDEYLKRQPKIKFDAPPVQTYQSPPELRAFIDRKDRDAELDPEVRARTLAVLQDRATQSTNPHDSFNIVADAMHADIKPEEFGYTLPQLVDLGQRQANEWEQRIRVGLQQGCPLDASAYQNLIEVLQPYLGLTMSPDYAELAERGRALEASFKKKGETVEQSLARYDDYRRRFGCLLG